MARAASTRLYELNGDVLYRIAEQTKALRNTSGRRSVALKALSSTCSRIRSHCMPILFRVCVVNSAYQTEAPPEAICPHVRHMRYICAFYTEEELFACGYRYPGPKIVNPTAVGFMPPLTGGGNPSLFAPELDYFPAIQSVAFEKAPGGVPWLAIKRCLDIPTLTSLSFSEDAMWMRGAPPTLSDLIPYGRQLTKFAYTPSQWRETERQMRRMTLPQTYTLESNYLRAFVLSMSESAESLTLPVETAPLTEMAAMDWPRLRNLSLVGRYTHPDQCRAISLLLSRAPNLHSLSIQVMQREGTRRPLLLQTVPENGYHLHSLQVSYPNPDDPMFSCLGDGLTSLALRDSPRHYFQERYDPDCLLAISPILTSSECLAILKRISGPRLSVLELVYQADAAEDELLEYLPQAFPLLQELELHRYRASPDDDVPYLHIAGILTSVKYLRALYMNLDVTDDPKRPSWETDEPDSIWQFQCDDRGMELLGVLQKREYFEYVALLLHSCYAGDWLMYYPPWRRERNAKVYSSYTVDCYAWDSDDGYR